MKFLEEEKERQSLFMNKKYFEKLNSIIYREIIGKNMVCRYLNKYFGKPRKIKKVF